MQKKDHSLDFLRSQLHLRSRTDLFSAINRIRSSAASTLRNHLLNEDFLEIFAPGLVFTDCEGNGDFFELKDGEKIFGYPTFLSGSGQLYAEIAAASHSKVFCFGPTFRAEKHNTSRHLSEFWMLEPEISFLESVDELADIIEAMLKECTSILNKSCSKDLILVLSKSESPDEVIKRIEQLGNCTYERINYSDAIGLLSTDFCSKKFMNPVNWNDGLALEHEKFLTDQIFKKPVFVTNYPTHLKPFYMKHNTDGKTVACLDLLVPGLAELVGGSLREGSHDKLLSTMQSRGMNTARFHWYLDLRKYGSVPHGGFGLGFERFLQYITGISNIRDVSMFPRCLGNNFL